MPRSAKTVRWPRMVSCQNGSKARGERVEQDRPRTPDVRHRRLRRARGKQRGVACDGAIPGGGWRPDQTARVPLRALTSSSPISLPVLPPYAWLNRPARAELHTLAGAQLSCAEELRM